VIEDRDIAWDLVFDSLPTRWRIRRGTYDSGAGVYTISAIGPRVRPGTPPQRVTGRGPDETAALIDLDAQLRALFGNVSQPEEACSRARLAYYALAEQWARATLGRALTGDELELIVRRYAGR
jgi:hypothetical protein